MIFPAEASDPVGAAMFEKFAVAGTPTSFILDGDGAEVDWFVGYRPPPESFQVRLEKVLKGEDSYKSLLAAYAANPKDEAVIFAIARKWSDRSDSTKAVEKYKEIIALDPDGKGGTYIDQATKITAPFTDFARYSIATANLRGPKPDVSAVKAFIAEYPKNPLVKRAYQDLGGYYFRGPKEEAEAFFNEYAARLPDDPAPFAMHLRRILRDKGPLEKGFELVAKLQELTASNPIPQINSMIARFYDLAGYKAKAEEAFGPDFMEGQVRTLANALLNYANYWTGKKENLPSAVAMADRALKLEPGDNYILREAAGVYMDAGEEAKALELYGPAWLEKNRAGLAAQELSGYAAFWVRRSKNLDSALAAARQAVNLEANDFSYWSTLSDVYAKMGDKAEAIKAAEKAVASAKGRAKENMQKKLDALKGPAPEKKQNRRN